MEALSQCDWRPQWAVKSRVCVSHPAGTQPTMSGSGSKVAVPSQVSLLNRALYFCQKSAWMQLRTCHRHARMKVYIVLHWTCKAKCPIVSSQWTHNLIEVLFLVNLSPRQLWIVMQGRLNFGPGANTCSKYLGTWEVGVVVSMTTEFCTATSCSSITPAMWITVYSI